MQNRGKQFEAKFKESWKESFPSSFLYRLPDQVSGYKNYSANPCDFIGFVNRQLFLIEAKSHYGNTFPLVNLTQYEKLIGYSGIPYVNCGVTLWFIDHDKVLWIDVKEIEKMKKDGKKSVNIKMLEDKSYNIIEIPSVKKKVFMDSDYRILLEVYKDEK